MTLFNARYFNNGNIQYIKKCKKGEFISRTGYTIRVFKDCGAFHVQVHDFMFKKMAHEVADSFKDLQTIFKELKLKYL